MHLRIIYLWFAEEKEGDWCRPEWKLFGFFHSKPEIMVIVGSRQMGESNAVKIRQPRFRRATWEATKAAYQTTLTEEERASGSIPATFQVLCLTIHRSPQYLPVKPAVQEQM